MILAYKANWFRQIFSMMLHKLIIEFSGSWRGSIRIGNWDFCIFFHRPLPLYWDRKSREDNKNKKKKETYLYVINAQRPGEENESYLEPLCFARCPWLRTNKQSNQQPQQAKQSSLSFSSTSHLQRHNQHRSGEESDKMSTSRQCKVVVKYFARSRMNRRVWYRVICSIIML